MVGEGSRPALQIRSLFAISARFGRKKAPDLPCELDGEFDDVDIYVYAGSKGQPTMIAPERQRTQVIKEEVE